MEHVIKPDSLNVAEMGGGVIEKLLIKNLHLAMDGDRDRDPQWSTGLSSQSPNEEQKEGEYEQGSQDQAGFTH